MRLLGIVAAVIGLAALASSSIAQADDDRGRFHFLAGASHFEAGAYEDALREFQRSYQISGRPELFYNFSLCYQHLNDLENAKNYLSRYLDEVKNVPNRTNLEMRLANLQRRLDDRAKPRDPEPAPGPAAPTVPADPDGTAPDGTATASPEPTSPPLPGDSTPSAKKAGVPIGALIGWGIGGAGLITGGAFGVLALSKRSSLSNSCAPNCTDDDVSSVKTFALIADVGLAVGLVGAALGTVLFLVGRGGGEKDVSHARRFELSPWVDPQGGGGAALGGSF